MRGSLPSINRLLQTLQAHGPNLADELAVQVAAHAPVGTREFADVVKDSIRGESEPVENGVRIRVVADLPDGTYPIDPVNAKALSWPGAEHPVRHVEHPFRVPSDLQEQSQADMDRAIDAEWDLIFAEIAGEA